MTAVRERRAWFNVPAADQPLRARQRPRAEPQPKPDPGWTLDELVVCDLFRPLLPWDDGLADQDQLEARDAAWECKHGRLPGDRTSPCGCFAQEPEPIDPGEFEPEPDTIVVEPEPEPAEPELIPEWALCDAQELRAGGMTLRKVATAILPVTDCPDIPSCEQLLKLRLQSIDKEAH